MSSTGAENLVHEGKLVVHIAENGRSFEVHCDETTLVEAVMQSIDSISGITIGDQLLLCSDMKLESHQPLAAYKLPSSDREVFAFNKLRLKSNVHPPPPELVDMPEVADPPPLAPSNNPHPLDDAADPALKALPSYERQFRYHYQLGHAIYSRTHVKYEHCERLLREQKVQERAVHVAKGNVEQYYRMIHQSCCEFMKRYKKQYQLHSDLLANFERYMHTLRSISLHPSLQTATRKCLLDFVKEENLRKSVDNCSISHKQFENKVSQFLNQTFAEVKQKVETLLTSRASSPIQNIELRIKEHQHYLNEQKSIMQSLSKDVNIVKQLVDDSLSSQISSSLRPHDAVSALGRMYDVHENSHLSKMQACEHAVSKLLDFCKDKKNEMNLYIHNHMQKIRYVSNYIIKDVKLQFPVFREAMVRQDDLFTDLKLIRAIGPAYRACLAEIVRRKASMKLYMGMAGQLAERLATKREVEVRRREEFLKAHGLYIPRDVLASMGLFDNPSQCDVNIAPFDTNLLDIDISDLDHYAPEYLAGLPCNSEKFANFKGSFSASDDISHSADSEEIGVDPLKEEADDLLEGCELVDIAGTSKLEVENAKLKAELASVIAHICSLCPETEYAALDDSKLDILLKNAAEKTAEALHLKDEYGKHLQSMLKAKQLKCISYEKRIQELENRLSAQYLQGQKFTDIKDLTDFSLLPTKDGSWNKPELTGGEQNLPLVSRSEPMDEASCISNSLDTNLGRLTRQNSKIREGVDENMMDSSGMLNAHLDSSMLELHRDEPQVGDKDTKDKFLGMLNLSLTNSSSEPASLDILPSETPELASISKVNENLVLELQTELVDKSNTLTDVEAKLKSALDEVEMLRWELQTTKKLLDESQINCAHLENCLHEAREEAQSHRCAADRRASEYSALRASAVKMRSLFERLRNCVNAPGGVAGFADSLNGLAQSLANSIGDSEDEGASDFRKCIRVLSDRVGFLARHREELLDKCPKIEASNEQLRKELEEKKELVKSLYTKHQHEKQANKEKISFGRLEVHEIAAFVLNSAGHYEAITRNSLNYYLSNESVELFTEHLPCQPNYIIGKIVHIERQTAKLLPPISGRVEAVDHLTSDTGTDRLTWTSGAGSNPYGLPVGCEYFIVTVAMLPDTSIHSSSPPS